MRLVVVCLSIFLVIGCGGSDKDEPSANEPQPTTQKDSTAPKVAPPDTQAKPAPSKEDGTSGAPQSQEPVPKEPTVRPPKKMPPTPRVLVVPKATSTRLALVEGVMARAIVDREPSKISNRFPSDVGQVNAFVRIKNDGPPTNAVMIWRYGDKEQFRIDLKIGTSPTWRTWSRMTMSDRKKGAWVVEILDETGASLGGIPFQID